MAGEFLAELEASGAAGSGAVLRGIIFGMPRDRENWTGIDVGFCSMVEIAAAAGPVAGQRGCSLLGP